MNIKSITSFACLMLAINSLPVQSAKSVGYWYDTSGDIVRNNFGECWRTIKWSSNNALAECEGGVKKVTKKSPVDSDKDGIVDSKDQCPKTVQGISVDYRGCAKDSDKDGVADSVDSCPQSKRNARVNDKGCEINNDLDNDGIVNSNDDCPNTAAGTVVNKQGCQLKADISLRNVTFATGTSRISASSQNTLDNVAQVLADNTHLKFEVAGHTDNTGNYQKNVSLSDKRAKAVRQYLVNSGVAAHRLTAKGYGPDKPVVSNATRDGRAQNRRVELVKQ